MSGMVNAAAPSQWWAFRDSLERRTQEAYLPDQFAPMFVDVDFIAGGSYQTLYWPGAATLYDGEAGPTMEHDVLWGFWDQAAGASFRYVFSGITRDQYGTAVPSCHVKLYLTATGALLDSLVSDANGYFQLSSAYYPDVHYIVAHKAGSPDIGGSTPNTLIGV